MKYTILEAILNQIVPTINALLYACAGFIFCKFGGK